jgi:inosine-uridine nucleoside N-ribohydrolase
MLTLCDRPDIPFYAGANEAILGYPITTDWHGEDGLGDRPDAVPTAKSISLDPSPGYAAVALVEAARQHAGHLTLVALGPLTNVALACKFAADLPKLVKSLWVMGGSEAKGNVTPTAEFNFHCDPEAAHIVLQKFPDTKLLTWDCTVRHATPWPVVDNWLSKDAPKARFMYEIMENSTNHMKKTHPSWGYIPVDPLCIALAIDDSLIVEQSRRYVTVELHGQLTRGQCVIDWYDNQGKPANVTLIEFINLAVFAEMMKRGLWGTLYRAPSQDSQRSQRSSRDLSGQYVKPSDLSPRQPSS